MKTYDRTTYFAARRAWDAGEFGSEWRRLRELSWERGFPYPPSGTRHDDREGPEPSQRAIIYAALDENPRELERIVRRSSSWSQVVDQIISMERRLAEDAGLTEGDAEWSRKFLPTHHESAMSIANILRRLADS